MRVRDVMTKNPLSISGDDALSTALQMMLWRGIRHLPVMVEGRVFAVLSERDILRYQSEHGADGLAHSVARAATSPATTAPPDEPLVKAAARMAAEKLGCLPVVEAGDLVGILTVTDVLAHPIRAKRTDDAEAPRAGDIMTAHPVLIRASDPLSLAIERMSANGIRHLPVVDGEDRLVGILSDRDIRPLSSRRAFEEAPVESVMTPSPISLEPGATRRVMLDAFTDWHLSAVPIVDEEERPIGIVSYVDLLRALAA